jgi:hypothetical protein
VVFVANLRAVRGAYVKPAAIRGQCLVRLQTGHHQLARHLYHHIGLGLQRCYSYKCRLYGLFIKLDGSELWQQWRYQLGFDWVQLRRHYLVSDIEVEQALRDPSWQQQLDWADSYSNLRSRCARLVVAELESTHGVGWLVLMHQLLG